MNKHKDKLPKKSKENIWLDPVTAKLGTLFAIFFVKEQFDRIIQDETIPNFLRYTTYTILYGTKEEKQELLDFVKSYDKREV